MRMEFSKAGITSILAAPRSLYDCRTWRRPMRCNYKPVIFALAALPAAAQWIGYKAPGIPRLPDGKPNLSAPVPRTADGKPDLSGLWMPGPNLYWVSVIQNIKDVAI